MVQPSFNNRHFTANQSNIIHLMVQQPTVLFGYWEVSKRLKSLIERHYRSSWHDLRRVARLYQYSYSEPDTAPLTYYDADVGNSECWYFRHVAPRHQYALDYGFLNHNQQFVSLLRSAQVGTPRNDPDWIVDVRNESATNQGGSQSDSQHQHDEQSNYSPFQQFSTYTLYSDN
ncbi:DUF4912 domain-containing protein [Paenibacillus sp. SC116]|uniref:DUF4912 domain-containing protein n=1 Tax=Paenibacillus sp. SC116 TaxID=2968986 RepID=UPI00215AA86B|nr:DUF4912 domain-containing protein [Paenibacillus sp. SC116]MCR8843844.1 DUF4912 domain-containing protein [Paenibacillus sp. SC116]